MTLSSFIRSNLGPIVSEWETFARTLLPSAQTMSVLALRDHCRQILLAVAENMETGQTSEEQATKSKGLAVADGDAESAAATHGTLRQLAGFDLIQLVAEFRALRASVLALWDRSQTTSRGAEPMQQMRRFNEAMDQMLAESVERYSAAVTTSRDMFLGILGHDLRGPLSAIVLASKVLAKHELSEPARQQAVLRIGRASKAMGELINDLLDYTRSQLGSGIPIELAECDLGDLCREALDAIRASYPELAFTVRASGELKARADSARIHQLLANLLGNAVQHGDRKTPIWLSAVGDSEAVILKVGNAGVPISPEAIQVIFRPLVQLPGDASDPAERSKTSLGLGLFIVQQIVLGHKGTINVQSSAEAGTVFTIRLPR